MILSILRKLNRSQLGRFGEFLSYRHFELLGRCVEFVNYNNADLRVNGTLYDAKTTARHWNKEYANNVPEYHGHREDGIQYIVVAFFANCAVFAENGVQQRTMGLAKISEYYDEYMRNPPTNRWRRNESFFQDQKTQIIQMFVTRHMKVRVKYRNGIHNQKSFGKYGPFNLLPKDGKKEDATVFLWLNGESIYEIMAFLHTDIRHLPLHPHRIGNRKFLTMTFMETPPRFRYQSLNELNRRFFSDI